MLPSESDTSHRPLSALTLALYNHTAIRYLIAGGLSFIVDFGLLTLLKVVFDWQLWAATIVAFLTSFVFNYLVQRMFSFGSKAPHGAALVKYAALVAFNTLATVGIVALVNETAAGWGAGKVVSTMVTTVWNYFAYRYWIFAAETKNPKADPRALPPLA